MSTIVSLTNSAEEASSFEDAFGEHSDFIGKKGRARRATRKADKQQAKMTKISARQERRGARKANRQTNRANRVAAKEDKRQMRVDSRQMRRDTKLQGKQNRKNLKAEQDQYRDSIEQDEDENVNPYMEQEVQDQESNDQGQFEEEQGGGYQGNQGYEEDGGYEGDQGQFEEEGYYEEDYGFDGEVDPRIQDLANKIEWNDELKSRLDDIEDADDIEYLNNRISELDNELNSFSADGSVDPRAIKMARINARRARRKAVGKGRGIRIRRNRPSNVVVDSGVDVVTDGNNSIVVPAESSSGMDGKYINVSGKDTKNSSTKSNFMNIAIGLGIAAIAIYALKKTKVL